MGRCKTCQGYGIWGIGDTVPMYRMDAEDGLPTIPCPECGANANPASEEDLIQDEEYDSNHIDALNEILQDLRNMLV